MAFKGQQKPHTIQHFISLAALTAPQKENRAAPPTAVLRGL